jgi:hypothetical protein
LLPPLFSSRDKGREWNVLCKLGTIVPYAKHTAQLERSMAKQNRHVNRGMNYLASTKISPIILFLLFFHNFLANFSKRLTTIQLTFVKNMKYSTCTLAIRQRG